MPTYIAKAAYSSFSILYDDEDSCAILYTV